MSSATDRRVVVVGAGVAGLSAAAALAQSGMSVTVLERRAWVGGRAYSYAHPALNETVDSQHVLVGCCANLIDLCHQSGLDSKIRWYDRQTWLEPATNSRPVRASTIAIGPLPAPLQYSGSFLTAPMLGLADKLAIARGLIGFARGTPGRPEESVTQWYRRTGQTERAIRHLWEPLVLATLNEPSANCSMKYAGKVFYELFLKNREGGRLGIPTVPLSEFYSGIADHIRANGGQVEFRASVDQLVQQPGGRWLIRSAGQDRLADEVILAIPFEQAQKLISGMELLEGEPARQHLLENMGHFSHSPFISILLWYDRQITDLDHAWLLDSTIEWFFHKSRIRRYPAEQGSYVEVIVAGNHRVLRMSREELLATAQTELARFFPEAARARLVKSGVLKEARATFALSPGKDAARPGQKTAWPGLYLAGDWTSTGWPSTMEGACRSGRLAAGAVFGRDGHFLLPEPPATGLSRLLA